ncbi:hypothetical protein PpBr36_03463 [Pyricularia pennisetigena]|uniref:hypothetical protein n=1 Tax=Pyricularia pennisetigena TaxID=1578925 RepID=UPI001153845B|nr:hypothetical protein PpBr36_03463 [Pyricularia pennisetigena]TLS30599.1 hypothetical protein PpBr36_03463 [Pyricularia pennisetigena]
MPSNSNHRYEALQDLAPIPTYDEAVAGSSGPPQETRSLLRTHQRSNSTATDPDTPLRSRRQNGNNYRPPTVETDDEDSLWGSDDGEGDAAQVRREMQELEMEDDDDHAVGRGRSTIFGKRLGFSLPRWRWRWQMPRLRIQLPTANATTSGAGPSSSGEGSGSGDTASDRLLPLRTLWERMPPVNAAQVCLVFGRIFAIFLILGFLYFVFMSDLMRGMRHVGEYNPESVRSWLLVHVNPNNIRDHLQHFTSYAHMAGTEGDYALATDVKNSFASYGLEDVSVEEYYVYINYPKKDGRAVEVLDGENKVQWSAKLEEEEHAAESAGRQTYAFHGHSKSGVVQGPLMYANYGSREDFKRLYDTGIETKGAIALVRHYGSQEDVGLKVKAAELAGFAGCIVYSDPKDDGFRLGEPAPNGRYMPEDGVQRGSVSLSSWLMGDPLSPGWESTQKIPTRLEPEKSKGLVQIPSIPLAWRDAKELLKRLQGFGVKTPEDWIGGVPDVKEWWTGNLSSPIVRLRNEQDEVKKKEIWNVYGRISGYEQQAKSIIIGNRRDSMAFGAAGPGSGTAVMMEVARLFADLRARGWVPMRTIDFMSWDGGEFNNAGSTEFVEKNLDSLRADAMAYINLDEAVTGSTFRASGSPFFRRLILQVLHRINDPIANQTLRAIWDERNSKLEGLGSASDYAAFQNIAGTSSLDIGFSGVENEHGRHPRKSSYDDFEWMQRQGDPQFIYHTLLAQILAMIIIELADRPIIPLDTDAFADSLSAWADEFVEWSGNKGANQNGQPPFEIMKLREAAEYLAAETRKFGKWEIKWENMVLSTSSYEPLILGRQRMEFNALMGRLDSNLLDFDQHGGAPNRTQFKHVLFGPQLWNSREPGYFPAIRDAVEAEDWKTASERLETAVKVMRAAGLQLESPS